MGTYSRSAGQLQVFVQAYHTPSSVRQQRFNRYHTRFHHNIPKHPVGFGTCHHTPFLPYPQTDLVGARTSYHTPLGPPASCTFITRGTQDITPGDNIIKSQNVITRVCYLALVTVISGFTGRPQPIKQKVYDS